MISKELAGANHQSSINPPSTWCLLASDDHGLSLWAADHGSFPSAHGSIGPLGPIGSGRSAGIVSGVRSTWSFPDGGRKKVDWGYIWMLQGRCPKYTKGGVHWRFFQHCNLQNIRCKQSSCPTAAEPVEAEWSSPYRSWCKPVRTCSWTRSFPTSYGKYQSNIAQNSTYHSTSVCQHFYSNIARLLFTVEILLCHSYACLHVRRP